MIYLKTDEQLKYLVKAGNILSECLSFLSLQVQLGVTGLQIDKMTEDFVRSYEGASCACKGYQGYPANICINVNSAAVHSIPNNKPFEPSDIVKLDLVVDYNGWKCDSAISVLIPPVKPEVRTLAETTYTAMKMGIETCIEGKTTFDVSTAIYEARGNCSVIREFTGHSIGRSIHESPQFSNVPIKEKNSLLVAGMVCCIEPIFCTKNPAIYYNSKEWNTWMLDGGLVSHWEHTLVINPFPQLPTVLTKRYNETF